MKEESAETAAETQLPDRPVSPHQNRVTEAGLKALEQQLDEARRAYEATRNIEDINERRRQGAIPLRDARYFAERLRTAVPEGATCSAGVATWDGEASAAQLIAAADKLLYAAKESGRDRTATAPPRDPSLA